MKKLIFIFYGFFLFTLNAYAQPGTPGLDARQKAQKISIMEGVASGDISTREFRKLKKQQRDLHRKEKLAKSDGIVSRKERLHLLATSRMTGRKIIKEKNDRNRF